MIPPTSLETLAKKAIVSSECSCDWKNIASLAIAVAGVALSIFSNSSLGVIGFALFGSILLLKWCETGEQVSQIERDLTQTIDAGVEKETVASKELNQDVQDAEKTDAQMEKQLKTLQEENLRLEALQKEFTAEERKLAQQNQILGGEKADLQRELEETTANLEQIRTEIQGFMQENLQLGATTGLFQKNVAALDGTRAKLVEELTSLDQAFDGNTAKLIEQIQTVKNASKEIIGAVSKESQELQQELAELRNDLAERQAIEQQSQQNIAAFAQERSQLQDQIKKGEEVQRQLIEQEKQAAKLEEQESIIDKEVLKTIEARIEEFKNIERLWAEDIDSKTKLSDALDQEIARKEAKLSKLS